MDVKEVVLTLPNSFQSARPPRFTPGHGAASPTISLKLRFTANGKAAVVNYITVLGDNGESRNYTVTVAPATGTVRLSELLDDAETPAAEEADADAE